jgi:hypothetical protein
MSEDNMVVKNMRNMAWERAKGELHSMLHTYWDEGNKFVAMSNEITRFVRYVEDHGLHE